MRSLRGRLLVGVVGALTILVVGFGAIVYLSVSRSLTDSFDASLTARARALSSLLRWDDDEPQLNFEEQKMPEFSRLKRPISKSTFFKNHHFFLIVNMLSGIANTLH